MGRRVLRRHIWAILFVYGMSHKKDVRLIWVNDEVTLASQVSWAATLSDIANFQHTGPSGIKNDVIL